MRRKVVSIVGVLLFASCIVIGSSRVVFAHVTVKPSEAVIAGFQTFTVSVPNERNVATKSIKLVMPSGVSYVSPTQKPGWKIAIDSKGSGDQKTVTSITWSGNEIKNGFRDEFTFSAKTPEQSGDLQWKAYQTYADGKVVSWDQPPTDKHEREDGSKGPFSVTKVVSETEQSQAVTQAGRAAEEAKADASRALYMSVVAVVAAFTALFIASRRQA